VYCPPYISFVPPDPPNAHWWGFRELVFGGCFAAYHSMLELFFNLALLTFLFLIFGKNMLLSISENSILERENSKKAERKKRGGKFFIPRKFFRLFLLLANEQKKGLKSQPKGVRRV